jgi:aspartate/methionine/tyrosine aminotransferase
VDHVYSDLIYDGREHLNLASFPGIREKTITVCSFSKSYPGMGGWRVGYAIVDERIISQLTKLQGLAPNMGGCTFAQKGAVEAYSGDQGPMRRNVTHFQKQRDRTVKRLNEMKGVSTSTPEASSHCFPRISDYGTKSVEFAYRLLKDAKIVVHPNITYNIEGHVRFNHSYPRFEEALDRMEQALPKIRMQRGKGR